MESARITFAKQQFIHRISITRVEGEKREEQEGEGEGLLIFEK